MSEEKRRKLPSLRLGRSKPEAGKHRTAPEPEPARPVVQEAPDVELEGYLAALAPSVGDLETTDPGRRFGGAQVYQVRMGADADEKLKALASERETSPLALLQDWVVQRLEWETRGRRR